MNLGPGLLQPLYHLTFAQASDTSMAQAFHEGSGLDATTTRYTLLGVVAILLGVWAVWVAYGLYRQWMSNAIATFDVIRDLFILATLVAIVLVVLAFG